MDIDKLTIGEARQIAMAFGAAGVGASKRVPMPVGKTVFIRTVTNHYCGVVTQCVEDEVELTDASWIADDGRFHDALKSGSFNEVEPYPDGLHPVINRASIIDWCVVSFTAPRAQK